MAFFRPSVFSPYTAQQQQAEPSFHGLFRLLEDWDNHHNTKSQSQHSAKRPCQRAVRRQQPTFTPRFDVQETESAYELHGELPGVRKQDINIEFSDPQTIVIRGSIERSSTTSRDSEGNLITSSLSTGSEAGDNDDEGVLVARDEDTNTTTSSAAAANSDAHSETASQRSLKATVEDDVEDQDTPATTTTTSTSASSSKDGTTTAAAAGLSSADSSHAATNVQSRSKTEPVSAKFWISERSVGTFSRTFEFPERIEIDNVSAGLENGVLSLRVPKAKKFGARQISVL